ncbi:DUF4912 domain-containing protein [Spirochaetia bacterium]|nr:DUF4912 domain-containing protein [Spirochaetia bacterium]
MELAWITKSYLESKSSEELLRLADDLGIGIPHDLERLFIIEELLDYSAAGNVVDKEAPPAAPKEDSILEPVPLPAQYNITFIEAIPRDPLWTFVYWEIKAADKEYYEKLHTFAGYFLLIEPFEPHTPQDTFSISVGTEDKAWYLSFPPEKGKYHIKLCAHLGEVKVVLAVSSSFSLPMLPLDPHSSNFQVNDENRMIYQNPLAILSGVEDFHILRNEDRLSRVTRYV